jgi:hypothetical protein
MGIRQKACIFYFKLVGSITGACAKLASFLFCLEIKKRRCYQLISIVGISLLVFSFINTAPLSSPPAPTIDDFRLARETWTQLERARNAPYAMTIEFANCAAHPEKNGTVLVDTNFSQPISPTFYEDNNLPFRFVGANSVGVQPLPGRADGIYKILATWPKRVRISMMQYGIDQTARAEYGESIDRFNQIGYDWFTACTGTLGKYGVGISAPYRWQDGNRLEQAQMTMKFWQAGVVKLEVNGIFKWHVRWGPMTIDGIYLDNAEGDIFFVLTPQKVIPYVDSKVLGALDSVERGNDGKVLVSGWACQSGKSNPIDVAIYTGNDRDHGGALVSTVKAQFREDPLIDLACGALGGFRFAALLNSNVDMPGQRYYAYGLSSLGTGDVLLTGSGVSRRANASDIQQIYQSVLGRAPTAQELGTQLSAAESGRSLQQVRNTLAQSDEAARKIRQLAIDVLGRSPSLTPAQARTNWGSWLNTMSLTQVREAFAKSDEAAGKIRQLFIDVLGRNPQSISIEQARRSSWAAQLNTKSLAQIRSVLAQSDEAAGKIRQLAIDVLGRSTSLTPAQARTNWGSWLNTMSLAQMRVAFANSAEGRAYARRR